MVKLSNDFKTAKQDWLSRVCHRLHVFLTVFRFYKEVMIAQNETKYIEISNQEIVIAQNSYLLFKLTDILASLRHMLDLMATYICLRNIPYKIICHTKTRLS